jgi:regulator of sirC expression with transglutaminase-like and TPR domain
VLAGYTRALQMCPVEDVEATVTLLTNRAESHRQLTQDHLTIQDCTAALALAPDNVKALLRRGLAYERSEKLQAALQDLKGALALQPGTQIASQGVLRITKLLKYDAAHSK